MVEATELDANPQGRPTPTERRIQGPPTFISIIHGGGGVLLCHRQGFTKVFLILDTTVHILNKLLEIYLKTHRGKMQSQ